MSNSEKTPVENLEDKDLSELLDEAIKLAPKQGDFANRDIARIILLADPSTYNNNLDRKLRDLLSDEQYHIAHYFDESVDLADNLATKLEAEPHSVQKAIDILIETGRNRRAAEIYLSLGDVANGTKLYGRGSPSSLYNEGMYWVAALFEKSQGRHHQAIEFFETAEHYRGAAEIYEELQEFSDAAKMYEKAEMYGKAVEMYERAEMYEEAAEIDHKIEEQAEFVTGNVSTQKFLRAIEQHKENKSYLIAARIYEKIGMYPEAAEMYKKTGNFVNSAKTYYKAKMYRKAAEMYEKAEMYSEAAEMLYLDKDAEMEEINTMLRKGLINIISR